MKDLNNSIGDCNHDQIDVQPALPLTLADVRLAADAAANALCVMLNDPDCTALDSVSDEDFEALETTHNELRTAYKTLRRIGAKTAVNV